MQSLQETPLDVGSPGSCRAAEMKYTQDMYTEELKQQQATITLVIVSP